MYQIHLKNSSYLIENLNFSNAWKKDEEEGVNWITRAANYVKSTETMYLSLNSSLIVVLKSRVLSASMLIIYPYSMIKVVSSLDGSQIHAIRLMVAAIFGILNCAFFSIFYSGECLFKCHSISVSTEYSYVDFPLDDKKKAFL